MASGGTTTTGSSDRASSSSCCWSVFDVVKSFPSSPEALMAEIDSAIAASEYAHASSLLNQPPAIIPRQKDARLADQVYKAGCAALASGKVKDAVRSLQLSLSLCPDEKTSAIAKLQSLISLASQHPQKPS